MSRTVPPSPAERLRLRSGRTRGRRRRRVRRRWPRTCFPFSAP